MLSRSEIFCSPHLSFNVEEGVGSHQQQREKDAEEENCEPSEL